MDIQLQQYVEFVATHPLGVIATTHPDAGPEAALVDMVADAGGDLVFGSKADARKMTNLAADPRMALVIGCEGAVTYQVEGSARVLGSAPDDEALREVFRARFPESKALLPGFALVAVRPEWIRRWDTSTAPPTVTLVRSRA